MNTTLCDLYMWRLRKTLTYLHIHTHYICNFTNVTYIKPEICKVKAKADNAKVNFRVNATVNPVFSFESFSLFSRKTVIIF